MNGIFPRGHTKGSTNVKEAYVELLVPLLKDLPFFKALNLELGYRYLRLQHGRIGRHVQDQRRMGCDRLASLPWRIPESQPCTQSGRALHGVDPDLHRQRRRRCLLARQRHRSGRLLQLFGGSDRLNIRPRTQHSRYIGNPDAAKVEALCRQLSEARTARRNIIARAVPIRLSAAS